MTWGRLAGWLTGLMLASLLLPAVASARIFSVMPANSAEEPAESFSDTDALFAIGTVDAFGGRVCIIAASQDESASCDAPAWGSPNNVNGFGTFIRPIEAPKLKPGTWRLLGDNDDPATNVTSEVFTVERCVATEEQPCDARLGAAAVQAYKDAAGGMIPATKGTCLASQLISAVGDVRMVKRVPPRRDPTPSAYGPMVAVSMGAGGALGFGVYVDLAVAWPSHEKALQLARAISCRSQKMYEDIVADPPDPDFHTPPVAEPFPLFETGEPAADALTEALERHVAHGRAGLKAFERYQGAVLEGDDTGVHIQSRAIGEHGDETYDAAYDAAAALRDYGAALAADPEVGDPIVTQAQLDEIVAAYERVTDSGFTEVEREELLSEGLSEDDIAGLREDFAATDIESAPVGRSAQSVLGELATELETRAAGFDQFAREGWAVASATNHAPVVDFVFQALPAQEDGYAFTFTHTASDPDSDPLTYEWSFGDGGTATGPQVDHSFAQGGEHEVTLTVSDGFETVTTTQTVVVRGRLHLDVETLPRDGRGVTVARLDAEGIVDDQVLYDQLQWFVDVVDGDYALEIEPLGGGRLAALTCDDGGSSRPSDVDLVAGTIDAGVETGEVVRCKASFVHDDPATIVVANDVLGPWVDPFHAWNYDGPAPFGPRVLTDGDEVSATVWPSGSLEVVAMGKDAHHGLESIACDDGASASPSAGSTGDQRATFGVDAGETVRCTFGWRPIAMVSAGPLRRIHTSPGLACSVAHAADQAPSFFGDFGCGTFLRAGDVTYGPGVPAGPSATGFTELGQTEVAGAGTTSSPRRVVTTVEAGDTGLRLRQVDTYVVGEEAYRTAVTVTNEGEHERSGLLYRAADCYLQNSDHGFGDVDTGTGAVACRSADTDEGGQKTPGARIEQWYPLSPGSHYKEAHFNTVWGHVSGGTPFDDTCECEGTLDNGAGLSWAYSLAPGQSVTKEHLTTFSPIGRRPLAVAEQAVEPTVRAGGRATYEIAVENPNVAAVGLSSITGTLPPGFSYVPGSTQGAGDPQHAGRALTWTGALSVPAGGELVLRFSADAPVQAGEYDSEASADAADPYTAVPTGPTARVIVLADEADPSVVLSTPAAGASYEAGEAVVADFACADDAGGTGIETCTGTVADGAPIDTTTAGTYAFEAVAVDRAGNRATVKHAYTVKAAPPPLPPPPPPPPPPGAPPPPPPPAAGVRGEQVVALGLPASRQCVSRRRFPIRLRAPRGMSLKSARVWVDGKRVKVTKKAGRLTALVDLRGLRKGRFTVLVRAVATDGRKVREQRRYRTCAKRRSR